MPPRERDGLYSQAERRFRDAVITFENGNRIEIIPEIRAMSVEPDGLDDMPTASAGAQEATFSLEGVDFNDIQGIIEEAVSEAVRRRGTAFQQTSELESAFNRMVEGNRDAIDALAYATRVFANAYGTSFIESLNAAWEAMGDDFELADEEEYIATDPISFDELMGGCCGDN